MESQLAIIINSRILGVSIAICCTFLLSYEQYHNVAAETFIPIRGQFNGKYTASYEVGSDPSGVAVNQKTDLIYVAVTNDESIAVINGSSKQIVSKIHVTSNPSDVAVNEEKNTIYSVGPFVTAINGTTNTIISEFPVDGSLEHIAINPKTQKIYATDPDKKKIYVIDGAKLKIEDTITTGGVAWGIAVNPDTNIIYVTNRDWNHLSSNINYISVIDGANDQILDTITVGDDPWSVAVDDKTNTIYVTNVGSGTVSVIDGKTNTVTHTIAVGGSGGITVDDLHNVIYGAGYAINGTTKSVIANITTQNCPCYVGVDQRTNTLYTTEWSSTSTIATNLYYIIEDHTFVRNVSNCNDFLHPRLNMSSCDLHDRDLTFVNLADADLRNANLRHANLEYVYLAGADLGHADLDGATLDHADLSSASLEGADLKNANLRGSILQQANLTGADLHDAYINETDLEDTNLQKINLSSLDMQRAYLNHSDLRGANLTNTDLRKASLYNSNLRDAVLKGTKLNGSVFIDAKVSSPLKQIAMGMSPDDVVCSNGLILVKSPKNLPACAKPPHAIKLLAKNWTLLVHDKSILSLKEGQKGDFIDGSIVVIKIFSENAMVQLVVVSSLPYMPPPGTLVMLQVGDSVGSRGLEEITLLQTQGGIALFSDIRYSLYFPICLSGNTMIDTSSGSVNVKNLKQGDTVWTQDNLGHKLAATILKTGKMVAPHSHTMVRLVLGDGRKLLVSQGHPTADGRFLGELKIGDNLDSSKIKSNQLVLDNENYTYDILPSGPTGFYWANGILVGSTLK